MTSNQAIQQRRNNAVPRGVATAMPFAAAKAENAELWDVEGKRYIDFAGGIAVLNTGHRHPKVMAAVAKQMEKFTHTAFQVVGYEPYVELAERLNKLAPGNFAKKTIFFTTGAEALENAVKISRHYTGRSGVVAFSGAFHGRTSLTMAMTGKVQPYKVGGPFPGEVFHVPFPNDLHGVTVADSLRALTTLFKADVDPARVACIVIEPVQGEGGFYVASKEFLQSLRKICDEHKIMLVSDEVQSGIARTGKMFAIEHSGVAPDLITTAKSLAGGFPLSAVIGRAEVMDSVPPGGLGGTYAGSPIGVAAGVAVLDVIAEEKLLERADQMGKRIMDRLSGLAKKNRFSCIGEVRGLGAMIAVELVKDRQTNEPDADLTKKVTAKAQENGLVLLSCGIYSNVLRILVPLTASDKIVDEGLDLIEKSIDQSLN
ncbi:MAG: 4-aminobutyrate--2-oxoglutarate transaminase [Hyphomicrobium sp.]|jgi:4-aminobutyrate aminotransferase/(S)-3-amino-2-methylpropionate transaminase|uniref:4-aminobutyrate--2-oxoglutarate transaminase n=1 Tax=Hyphomicrobium sp. TaxID=82 RepID=UPI003D148DE5